MCKSISKERALPQRELGADTLLKANLDEFAVLDFGGKPMLLDKQRHSCSMLDEPTAEVFRKSAQSGSMPGAGGSEPGVRHLFEIGALVVANECAGGR